MDTTQTPVRERVLNALLAVSLALQQAPLAAPLALLSTSLLLQMSVQPVTLFAMSALAQATQPVRPAQLISTQSRTPPLPVLQTVLTMALPFISIPLSADSATPFVRHVLEQAIQLVPPVQPVSTKSKEWQTSA